MQSARAGADVVELWIRAHTWALWLARCVARSGLGSGLLPEVRQKDNAGCELLEGCVPMLRFSESAAMRCGGWGCGSSVTSACSAT
eukprot:61513-Rhodomonas_salina.2